VINAVYDASWATNANAAAATLATQRVITEMENLFTNNVTMTISFGFGAAGAGGAFEQEPNFSPTLTLGQMETLLHSHATASPQNTVLNTAVLHLPASYTNPKGSSGFYVNDGEYMALSGGVPQNADAINASINVGPDFPGQPWNYGTTGANGTIFFQGVMEHEITHAMGRIDYAFAFNGTGPPFLTPLDFYKYDPGTTTLDPTFVTTGFSYDGGTTQAPQQFSNQSDSADWGNAPGDSFNAFDGPFLALSSTDIAVMNALGWDSRSPGGPPSAVPEPATLSLLAVGGALVWFMRRRRYI
jgi:hypothetical protein